MVDNTSFKLVNTSWMMQGQACWITVNETNPLRQSTTNAPMYVRGHIQKLNGNRTSAKLLYMEQHKGPEDVAVKDLQKANNDYDKFPEGWTDVSAMNIVNDPEILGDLKLRFKQLQFYTYSNKTLISCGVKASDDIASLRSLNEYKLQLFDKQSAVLKDVNPHVFSMLFLAHQQIQNHSLPQQIFFSGLSGSGKTTNVRACLKYLTKLKEETGGPKAFTLEEMVSTTQKLIQALGSAKNSANTYSSRYFVNYRFTVNTANKKTLGLAIQSVFLETSRLWQLTQKQASFFIFSLMKLPALQSQVPVAAKFQEIFSQLPEVNYSDNEEDYGQLFNKLNQMGFLPEELEALVRVVAAVAYLTSSSAQGSQLADILQCPALASEDLSNEKNRLVLAQDLYVKLFNWVIQRSNELTQGREIDHAQMQVLSLMDCGGLEHGKTGSWFESFTTNYASECIEQFFIRFAFKHISDNFKAEQLHDLVKTISYQDNQNLIDFYENQLFAAIQDDDSQTYESFKSQGAKVPELFQDQGKSSFMIKHPHGSVEYNVENFGLKNNCKVIDGFTEKVSGTSSATLKQIFTSSMSTSLNHSDTLKQQIDSFYKQSEQADHIFIKCVKVSPTANGAFSDPYVYQQLLEQNMLNSVKLQKTGYTQRMSYNEYYKRYHLLDPINEKIPLQRHLKMGTDMRSLVMEMNKRIFPNQAKNMYILGSNNLYMQSDTGYKLEDLLKNFNKKVDKTAVMIQSAFKAHQYKKSLMRNVSKLAKLARENPELKGHVLSMVQEGNESRLLTNPNEFIKPKKQMQQANLVQEAGQQPKQYSVDDHLSDKEAYSLLTLNQKEDYKKKKAERKALHQQLLEQGKPTDGMFDEAVSVSLLTLEQKEHYNKKRTQMGYVQKENELKSYEMSDPESYALLEENQVEEYKKAKHDRETTKQNAILSGKIGYQEPDYTTSFALLTTIQREERTKKHHIKEQARKKDEIAALIAEEGFISDEDCFALLSEIQRPEYIQKKKEHQIVLSAQNSEMFATVEQEDSISFQMLTLDQQKQAKEMKQERHHKDDEKKKLGAMEAYLSDTEAYTQLNDTQRDTYKKTKMDQNEKGQTPFKQLIQGEFIPLSYSLLNEVQKEERRKLKVDNMQANKRKAQRLYAVDGTISDEESFVQLSEIQKNQYKKQKEEKKAIKKEMNGLKYGFEGAISDPESLKLLTADQKKEWNKRKNAKEVILKDQLVVKKIGVKVISDSEILGLLDSVQKQLYIATKLQNPHLELVAESLLNQDQLQQKQALTQQKVNTLRDMDETGITPLMQDSNIDLTTCVAYELLNLEQKIERKRIQQELEKARKTKLQNNQYAASEEVADSIAFGQLSVIQRDERKKKGITKEKLKNILNPVLFAEDLDLDQSIAFALLTDLQKQALLDQVQDQPVTEQQDPTNSVAFAMCSSKQKEDRNKRVQQQQQQSGQVGGPSDLSDGELVQVKNLEEKKQLQRKKIEALEHDKFNFAQAGGFSDYDAFCILDDAQKDVYKVEKAKGGKDIAHNLLNGDQKARLRRRKMKKVQRRVRKAKRAYGVEGAMSDVESFLQLTEPQQKEYLKAKQGEHQAQLNQNIQKYGVEGELSDEGAVCLLSEEQKNQWKAQKDKKQRLQTELVKAGFALEYPEDPEEVVVLTLKDFEDREKKITKLEKAIEDEEKKLIDDLQRQGDTQLADQKKHGQEEDRGAAAKRPTMMKRFNAEQMATKSDDFKTRGLDVWPIEATVYMMPIADKDARKDTCQKLISHPELQPYVVPKTQKDKRLLESGAAPEDNNTNPQIEEYDPNFIKKVKDNDFHVYCDKVVVRNKQFGKKDEIAKMMKHTSDNLQEPLTAVDDTRTEKAKQMFRSLLKVGNVKKSRFTPKQHQEKILVGVLGTGCLLELPPPPQKLLKSGTGKYEKYAQKQLLANKEKQLDGDSEGEEGSSPKKGARTKAELDKIAKDEKNRWNEFASSEPIEARVKVCTESPMAKLREEAFLQVFKQLGRNKAKDQVVPLLKFGVILSSICTPTKDGILPMLNCLLDKLENDKLYKEPEVNKPARRMFLNLAQMAQSLMLQNKTKELTRLFPQQVVPEQLVATFELSKGDTQLKEKDKLVLAQLRILKSEKEPLIPIFFKIAQGLTSVVEVQYYQLQNVLPRKYLPTEDEQTTMDCLKQCVIKLYLFSETPIWVVTTHNALVHEVRDAAAKYVGKDNLSQFFALYLVMKENNQVTGEKYLEDDEKAMDVITLLENNERVWQDQYKQQKTFQIYLRVRIYYRLFKHDFDSIDIFYFQQVYEMQRNRYPVKPSDATLLGAIEMFTKYGKYDPSNPETTKEAVENKIAQIIPQKLLNGSFQEIRMRYYNEYLPTYSYKEWAINTQDQYKDLTFDSAIQARWEYLSILRYYDMFLTQQFVASFFMVSRDGNGVMRKTQAQDCVFAIRPLYVVVSDFPGKKTIRTIHFFDINSWGESEKGQNYFFVKNEDGSVSIFEFNERAQADYTLNAYVNWSCGKPVDSHLCQEFNDVLSYLIEKNNE